MQSKYNTTIKQLQSEFKQIESIYKEIQIMKTHVQEKIQRIKEVYTTLITNNNKKRFLFCLDTFFFQYKTLHLGSENLNRYISLINNRMYGDYYKLYEMIFANPLTIKEMNQEPPKKYTTYQELEIFHEYPPTDIHNMHGDIITNINIIFEFYIKKSDEIQEYDLNQIGISIDNFINTLKYDNTLILEQVNLYIGYMSFFHKSHTGFLINLLHKIQIFQNEIEDNLISKHKSDQEDTHKGDTIINIENIFGDTNETIMQF